jgi:hypothetical protein
MHKLTKEYDTKNQKISLSINSTKNLNCLLNDRQEMAQKAKEFTAITKDHRTSMC